MSTYEGSLRIPGDDGPPLAVTIDLTGDRLRMSAGDSEIGNWPKSEIRVNALPDGFHLRAEGEEVLLDVTEDAQFAVDLGLRTAPPHLRRRMSALMRRD
ncbi:MAG: hypothetical protein OEQ47_12735 [Acidimicrobiia bacterium]|nr:hypothetical protein [Acidimicrobiia bacterium]